jgi:4-carboxymuconolactone decarboxylase
MARLPLPTRESLPPELQERWDRTASRGPVLNIQRLFLVNPDLEIPALKAWRATGLSDRAREIVILRCAFLQDSRYEWHQHVRIGRAAGLTDAEINAITNWEPAGCFSEDERALLAYVDEVADNVRPSNESFSAMSKGRSDAEVLGVTYLITLYFQLARVMAIMDLETEVPFVGWELGNG